MSCGELVVKGLVRGATLRAPARGAALTMPGHQLSVRANASQLQVRCCAPGVSITQRSSAFTIAPQYKQLTVAPPAQMLQIEQRAIRFDLRCSPGARGAPGAGSGTPGVAGVPLTIAAGDNFTVPENVQMVYVFEPLINGTLTLDGVLAKVL